MLWLCCALPRLCCTARNHGTCPLFSSQVQQFVLFESAVGYTLFEVVETEEIGALLPQASLPPNDC